MCHILLQQCSYSGMNARRDTTASPMREVASFFLFVLIALDFGNSVYQRHKNEGKLVIVFVWFFSLILGFELLWRRGS